MADGSRESRPGILVIEDEALVARDIESRLTSLGYDVVGLAHNPRQALDLAQSERPDLLLCDIHLKEDVDGIDVASTITRQRHIPVIFLTAYSDRETVTRAKTIAPYGYVLKPIETSDLQIAIDMAWHKFSIERELHSTRQLLATALQCIGDALVFVGPDRAIKTMNEEALELFGLSSGQAESLDCLRLLVDRSGPSHSATLSWEELLEITAVTRLSPFQIKREGTLLIVDGVAAPNQVEQEGGTVFILRTLAEIQDPVENLPLPDDLPADFRNLYDYPQDHERAFVLLLICPDNADTTLGKLPRAEQNALIQEIGEQLSAAMRSTDLASYYGGTVFSASLPFTTLEEASSIASAIIQRLSQRRFLDRSLELTVSIGISHHGPESTGIEIESPLELFRRANRALTLAQQSGGNRMAIWRPSTDIGLVGNLGGESDLLTHDAGQDYRNMALMWNTMSSAASLRDTSALAEALVSRVKSAFGLQQAALYNLANGNTTLVAAEPPGNSPQALTMLTSHRLQLTDKLRSRAPVQQENHYLVPFDFGEETTGVLYMCTTTAAESLRRQDLLLVQSLNSYIAGRGKTTSAPSMAPKSTEQTASELLFQSEIMEEVSELIRLVAPTDETVLITGESGTGKEVIAREIHRRSQRSNQPFVIVDCGAVVSTLIERELFGHIKGAFTGAVQSSPGKLKEADGGTLLLDEIGELPLDVQVKLLRVVQDKQFTAVGSTQVETTDTRIIAATNVDLEEEIRRGRFREDLFYRLNVFNVHSPPLRQREGDVLFLARHFLERCSRQYDRDIVGFTHAAEEVIMRYPWPGNIRELRNKLIRAVILCPGNRIDVSELGLRRQSDKPASRAPNSASDHPKARLDDSESLEEIESVLRGAMAALVNECISSGHFLPLSNWLEQDVILAALELHNQINLQAAEALDIPESTLRRKLSRYRADRNLRPPEFEPHWRPVVALLPNWIQVARDEGLNPLRHLQNLMLSEIRDRAANQSQAAMLVGVSPPTYRRQINQLANW